MSLRIAGLLLGVAVSGAHAQTIAWDRPLELTGLPSAVAGAGNVDGQGRTLAVAADGSTFQIGRLEAESLAFVAHYGPNGEVRWTRTFDPLGNTAFNAIVIGGDGSLYVAGQGTSAKSDLDALLMKLDAAGNVLWVRTRDPSGRQDVGHSVQPAPDGGVYLIGGDDMFAAGAAVSVTRYGANGALVWTRIANVPGLAVPAASAVAGGEVLVGINRQDASTFHLVRIAANGGQRYAVSSAAAARVYDVATDGAGATYIGAGGDEPVLIKVDDDGVEQWARATTTPADGATYGYVTDIDASIPGIVYTAAAYARGTNQYLSQCARVTAAAPGTLEWSSTVRGLRDFSANPRVGANLDTVFCAVEEGGARRVRVLAMTAAAGGSLGDNPVGDGTRAAIHDLRMRADGSAMVHFGTGTAYGRPTVLQVTAAGVPFWSRALGELPIASSAVDRSLAISPDGDVAVVAAVTTGGDRRAVVRRYAPDGTQRWRGVIDGVEGDDPAEIGAESDGDLRVLTRRVVPGGREAGYAYTRIRANGDLRAYDVNPLGTVASFIGTLPGVDGGRVVVARAWTSPAQTDLITTLQSYDATGTRGNAATIEAAGSAVQRVLPIPGSGDSAWLMTTPDALAIRRAAPDGAVVWQTPLPPEAFGAVLAADGGAIYVATTLVDRLAVIRLSASTGAVEWTATRSVRSQPSALAIDAAGVPVVVGADDATVDGVNQTRPLLLRLDPATGAERPGTQVGTDNARYVRVALDPDGSAYAVAILSPPGATRETDVVADKIGPAGGVLWRARYDVPGGYANVLDAGYDAVRRALYLHLNADAPGEPLQARLVRISQPSLADTMFGDGFE